MLARDGLAILFQFLDASVGPCEFILEALPPGARIRERLTMFFEETLDSKTLLALRVTRYVRQLPKSRQSPFADRLTLLQKPRPGRVHGIRGDGYGELGKSPDFIRNLVKQFHVRFLAGAQHLNALALRHEVAVLNREQRFGESKELH